MQKTKQKITISETSKLEIFKQRVKKNLPQLKSIFIKVQKILVVFTMFIFSFISSIIVLCIALNYYLKWSGKGKTDRYTEWTLSMTNYSQRYIYWRKPWCEVNPSRCFNEEEKFLSHPVEYFYPNEDDQIHEEDCIKILFLGDSFTDAPWTDPEGVWSDSGGSYASEFSRNVSEKYNVCIKQYRVSTGGTGTSQQLARFKDVVEILKPNIVIWQFFSNDIHDNILRNVYSIKDGKLLRKNTVLNSLFLAGFIHQKFPIIRNTTLGYHFLYLGEKKDLFKQWPVDPHNPFELIQYNKTLIPLLLEKMESLSQQYNFSFYTTLAPLESQYLDKYHDKWAEENQDVIQEILENNTKFISMTETKNDQILGITTNRQLLFQIKEDKSRLGSRHLSKKGNVYFGRIFFENFYSGRFF